LNHGSKLKSIHILHAYKIATIPRKPAQRLSSQSQPARKFGLDWARNFAPLPAYR
jgi:hypothetical protein